MSPRVIRFLLLALSSAGALCAAAQRGPANETEALMLAGLGLVGLGSIRAPRRRGEN
jgi:hypothetical protein